MKAERPCYKVTRDLVLITVKYIQSSSRLTEAAVSGKYIVARYANVFIRSPCCMASLASKTAVAPFSYLMLDVICRNGTTRTEFR
jgi:hypothetical protein